MKITILGSGNGGCAMAADWSLAEHEVSLFDFESYSTQIKAINKVGGIYVEGELNGFAPIAYAGHSIEKAVKDTELIVVVGPAYSTEAFAKAVKPYIKKGQDFIVCPGSIGGGLLFKKTLGLEFEDESIAVAETSTLPYACRNIEPGLVHIYLKLKGGIFISTLPSQANTRIHKKIDQVYNAFAIGEHYLHTMFQNANPVIHPAVTLMNAGRIESTNGDFYFYEDGVMPAVGRLIKAVDDERISIGNALGINILSDPKIGVMQGYMTSEDYETAYSEAPGFKGVKAQSQLDHRYLNEDVGYGLVLMSEIAKKLNVETPIINSIINISSKVMEKDYRNENKRSLEILGLSNYSLDELKKVFSNV
jgi:opine dehydrogenase